MKEMIEKGIKEFEGVRVINTTPHPVNLKSEKTGEEYLLENSGVLINASTAETVVGRCGEVEFVKVEFKGNPEGEAALGTIPDGVIVVGSIIAAQAYPGRVVAMTPAKGFERVPPAEKRMNLFKYTIF